MREPSASPTPAGPRTAASIENYAEIRERLAAGGVQFTSQTDTEVLGQLINSYYAGDLLEAVKKALNEVRGSYALAVISIDEPGHIVGARLGSPMVLGLSDEGSFIASDAMALAGVTQKIVFLEDGDVVDLRRDAFDVLSHQGAEYRPAERAPLEIFEQPRAISDTLQGLQGISPEIFGEQAAGILSAVKRILMLACGTSYYAACTAKYWIEAIAGIPCDVEIASEYRYRKTIPDADTLVVTVSQSGETADTIAALKHAKSLGMTKTLAVCNVRQSALVRESALCYITRAGVEIGVASTKAFTTQLIALYLLTLTLAKVRGQLSDEAEQAAMHQMRHLPSALLAALALEPQIIAWAEEFAQKDDALFLGRGQHYPIALEGALKLKEISYIHAEAYPAGELKHGPLALVDDKMPVVTVAPNDRLLEKLKSNMQEVRARGGRLYVIADADSSLEAAGGLTRVLRLPEHYGDLSPILHVVPLQLLAYHTALVRGTDVDKPRYLAKSVTVE